MEATRSQSLTTGVGRSLPSMPVSHSTRSTEAMAALTPIKRIRTIAPHLILVPDVQISMHGLVVALRAGLGFCQVLVHARDLQVSITDPYNSPVRTVFR